MSVTLSNAVVTYHKELDVGSIEGRITLGNDQDLPGGVEPNSLGYEYEGMRPPYIWRSLDLKRISGYEALEVPELSMSVKIRGIIPVETVRLAEEGRIGLGTNREKILPLNSKVEDIVYSLLSDVVNKHCNPKRP